MTTPDPRDRTLEPLLRRHLAGVSPDPAEACPDAEALAAWVDRGLDATTYAVIETHLAGCARCQATVAAIVQTAPAPAAAVRWWQTFDIRWLVPVGAAAAAVVLYLVAPSDPPPGVVARFEPPTVERFEPQTEAPTSAVPSTPQPMTTTPVTPEEPKATELADARTEEPKTTELEEARTRAANAQDTQALKREKAEAGQEAPAPQAAGEAAPPVPSAPPVGAMAAPSPPPAPSVDVTTAAPPSSRRAAEEAVTAFRSDPPAGPRSWRRNATGGVERSVDQGTTWTLVSTPAPVTAVAGVSADTCWAVGADGLVLLTTDGRTWATRTAPAQVDLVGIDAADAVIATARAADGRAFRTTDGGASWAPLQH